MKDYYKALGISNKTIHVIIHKQMFEQNMKQVFQNAFQNCQNRFTPRSAEYINAKEAYDVLIDPQKREEYHKEFIKHTQELRRIKVGQDELFNAIDSNNNQGVQNIIIQAKEFNIFDAIVNKNEDGEFSINALHSAVNKQNIFAVDFFKKEIDINSKTSLGCSSLRLAIKSHESNDEKKALEIIGKLIKFGADVTAIDGDGNSLLGYTIERMRVGSRPIVNALVLEAEKQGTLDGLIESYIGEDKSKRDDRSVIAEKLGQNLEEHLRKMVFEKLFCLTEFLDNPKVLFPVIDRLKEKGIIPAEATRAAEITFVERERVRVRSPVRSASSNENNLGNEGSMAKRVRVDQGQAESKQTG